MAVTADRRGDADTGGWPERQAADGDRRAQAELVERCVDELHAVCAFLGDDEGATARTAAVAAAAAASEGWSTADELGNHLFGAAAGCGEGRSVLAAPPAAQRALALVELGRRNTEDAAADLEIPKEALARDLARGRVALRRGRTALPGGGRCLRARELHSQSLDEGLGERQSRLLAAHLACCPFCREHESLLAEELGRFRGAHRTPADPAARDAVRAAVLGGGESPQAAKVGFVEEEPREQGDYEPSTEEEADVDDDATRASEIPPEADDATRASEIPSGDEDATRESETPTEPMPPGSRMEPALAGAGAGEHGPSPVDAMGLDKHREVRGRSYGPSKARQAAVFGIFFACVAALLIGGKLLADKLDEAPNSNPDKAPWSKSSAPQIPAQRPQ